MNKPVEPAGRVLRRVARMLSGTVLVAALLFGTAGRLDWWPGWLLVGLFLAYSLALSLGAGALLEARRRQPPDTPPAELALLIATPVLIVVMLGVAGLEARAGLSSRIPLVLQIAGWVILLPAAWLATWALLTNPFAIAFSRIQPERGQQVITHGPYRLVRHPVYAGAIAFALGTPLGLGSAWALLPGGALAALFVGRTITEDAILRQQLPGYAEYAAHVRYRLLPRVW